MSKKKKAERIKAKTKSFSEVITKINDKEEFDKLAEFQKINKLRSFLSDTVSFINIQRLTINKMIENEENLEKEIKKLRGEIYVLRKTSDATEDYVKSLDNDLDEVTKTADKNTEVLAHQINVVADASTRALDKCNALYKLLSPRKKKKATKYLPSRIQVSRK